MGSASDDWDISWRTRSGGLVSTTGDVLATLGSHPDKTVAKVARKSLFPFRTPTEGGASPVCIVPSRVEVSDTTRSVGSRRQAGPSYDRHRASSTLVTVDDSPTAAELRARGSLKWTSYPDDVLAAWVAEMDFGLAPAVAEALSAAVERGDTGYHYPDIERAAAGAACGFWGDRLGWDVAPERVVPAPDVVEGIRRAIVHLTAPGSPVVLHTPVYYPFFSMLERAGRELREVPCRPGTDGRYTLDIDEIDRALADGAGSVVLCNPWNPTGRCFTEEELGTVIEVVASHTARVIADEVHAPLVRARARHVVAATLDPDTVITVTSASKAWNIPGLKCAQVILTRDSDLETWTTYFTPDKVGVGTFGLVANAAAYAGGREWLEGVVDRLDGNRRLLTELIGEHLPRLGYAPSEGTYLAWLDFRPYGLDDPAAYLLEHARVALTGGAPFGVGGGGHARLNFATSPAIVTEIVERIGAAVAPVT